jgi:hypothetical protein
LTNDATTHATDTQPTPLKAASFLVLQRNRERNRSATENYVLWITQQKQRNFCSEKMDEKLRPVAPVVSELRGQLQAETSAADPITQAAKSHGLTQERLRNELTQDDIQAIADDLPGERRALEVFASILAAELIKEQEQSLQENFQERSGILEFDGGMPRDEAEETAFKLVFCSACCHSEIPDVHRRHLLTCAAHQRGGYLKWSSEPAWCEQFKAKEAA